MRPGFDDLRKIYPYYYSGTITFAGHYTPQDKIDYCKTFHDYMAKQLPYYQLTKYLLHYSIEYHKTSGEDDIERPHIHFILFSARKIPGFWYKSFCRELRNRFGIIQFYLSSTKQTAIYYNYIYKDSERLESIIGYPHYFMIELQQTFDEPKFHVDFFDEFNSEL